MFFLPSYSETQVKLQYDFSMAYYHKHTNAFLVQK